MRWSTILTCLITDDIHFGHLIKVVSDFPTVRVFFLFVIKYFVESYFEAVFNPIPQQTLASYHENMLTITSIQVKAKKVTNIFIIRFFKSLRKIS